MTFNVRLREQGRLFEFTTAHRVLHAHDPAGIADVLDAADAALRAGYWIAGYLCYEAGAAFVNEPTRPGSRPLAALGVFDAPAEGRVHAGSFALSPLVPRVDAVAYAAAVDRIRAHIYDGDVYQVNYTLPFDLHLEGDRLALWHAIGETTGAAYQAYVEDGDRALLSWSPELFLRFDGTRVTTKPMKGTARGDDTSALSNAKNRAEHVMIVDLLRNDLHRLCDEVTVEALCTIERYPHFATMTSTIAGTLRDNVSLRDIFTATFPCGSITGAPKRAAFATIAQLEPSPREAYCGSIGYLAPERRGWWNVAIRTAQIDDNGIGRYDAGGGIVADSRAADEWHEVLLKTAFIDAFAQPLELLETLASDAETETFGAHLARLEASAQLLRIPLDRAETQRMLRDAMAKAGVRSLIRLRLRHDGHLVIRTEPLVTPELPLRVCIAPHRVRSDDVFLRIKSAWRPAANAAQEWARSNGCFDALLINERGELTEGSRTTLFVQIEGTLYTPPLDCGVLPGILRSRIVSEGRAHERVLYPHDLTRADAISLGNSARGLLPVRMI